MAILRGSHRVWAPTVALGLTLSLVALTRTGCASAGACQEAIDHLAERLPDFGCNPFPADTARMRIIEDCGDLGTWTIGALVECVLPSSSSIRRSTSVCTAERPSIEML